MDLSDAGAAAEVERLFTEHLVTVPVDGDWEPVELAEGAAAAVDAAAFARAAAGRAGDAVSKALAPLQAQLDELIVDDPKLRSAEVDRILSGGGSTIRLSREERAEVNRLAREHEAFFSADGSGAPASGSRAAASAGALSKAEQRELDRIIRDNPSLFGGDAS